MKRLAQILTLSIFFAIAVQQISVAQMFDVTGDEEEIAEKEKENARKDSIIAEKNKENARLDSINTELDKRNAETKKRIAEKKKKLARLKAQKKSQQNKDAKKENN